MGSSGKQQLRAAEGAVGGKAARACDGCLRRRARWYCAADDAFLCQGCDTSVHSANPLARRHERLRLCPAAAAAAAKCEAVARVPAWFKRKARTPRPHVKPGGHVAARRHVVPEAAAESSEGSKAEEEEGEGEQQLLYRVPVFDPALAEFCSPPPPLDDACKADGAVEDPKPAAASTTSSQCFPDTLPAFGPTDAELREFAADMEALLGGGLDDGSQGDSFYMEALGLADSVDDDAGGGGLVKRESDGAVCGMLELEPEASADMLHIDFECGSLVAIEEAAAEEKAKTSACTGGEHSQLLARSLSLRLDYEAIIASWGSSPWTGGERPRVHLDDCFPHDYSGMWMAGEGGGGGHGAAAGMPRHGPDGGRVARVTRYREKRRTRLFSKKIRYEVRKLNAEKRPRMKGRFIKRTTTGAAAAATACFA